MKENFNRFFSEKEEERKKMKNLEIRNQINRGEDPYKGKIIKAGNYSYEEAQTYEDTVNSILQNSSESIEELVKTKQDQQEKIAEILRKTNHQKKADEFKGVER